MRQILEMPTTLDSVNTPTCGFCSWKGQCTRGFRNLPHTSDGRFQKCGENPRPVGQTPIMDIHDLRFCRQDTSCARRFSIFPSTSEMRGPAKHVLATLAASATTSSSRGNVKGPLSETEQRPFFVSASRRVHGNCITEDIIFNQIKSAVRTFLCNKKAAHPAAFFSFGHEKRRPPFVDGRL